MPQLESHLKPAKPGSIFFGWQVVACAFVIATFSWGVGFYGPSVFLAALSHEHGWRISLISAAVTLHFLASAAVVSQIAYIHDKFGLVAVTRFGALSASIGMLAWASATAPWQLFPASLLTGIGFAVTSGAAINAIVMPWFKRLRPVALGVAFNGASVGGIVFAPLWQFLIVYFGLFWAAVIVGVAMTTILGWLAGRYLRLRPADLGLFPDGELAYATAKVECEAESWKPPLPQGVFAWADRRFLTLSAAFSLGLFAQIGTIISLVLIATPVLGQDRSSLAISLVTGCAIVGRTLIGLVIPPNVNWRIVASANFALQVVGTSTLIVAGVDSVIFLIIGCILFGIGVGSQLSLPPQIAALEFAHGDIARVMALVTAANQTSYAFAPMILGILRDLSHGSFIPLVFTALLQISAATIVSIGRVTKLRSCSG